MNTTTVDLMEFEGCCKCGCILIAIVALFGIGMLVGKVWG